MLGGGKRESAQGREEKMLQHLHGRAEDQNWAVAGALLSVLEEGHDCCIAVFQMVGISA